MKDRLEAAPDNVRPDALSAYERERQAIEHLRRESPRVHRKVREHLRRAQRLIDGLPPDW